MFTTKRKYIGLDYGSHSLRAIELEEANGTLNLSRWASAPVPPGAINAVGEVTDIGLLATTLKDFFRSAKLPMKQVVTMVPSSGLVIRNILLPQMEPEELREAAKWEAAQYLPYPIEEATYDLVSLQPLPFYSQLPDSEVLLIAAHTPKIMALVEACQRAGLDLVGIDAAPLAMARAIGVGEKARQERYPPRQQSSDPLGETAAGFEVDLTTFSEAIINLGYSTTDVSIFQNGGLRVNRSFTIGLANFDQKIMERLGVSWAEATHIRAVEARVDVAGIIPIGEEREIQITAAVQGVAEELLEEIQRSLDYYRAQNGWIPIDRVVVIGDGVKLHGLIEYLSNNLGVALEVGNPLVNLAPTDTFSPDIELYSTAIGLALWGCPNDSR